MFLIIKTCLLKHETLLKPRWPRARTVHVCWTTSPGVAWYQATSARRCLVPRPPLREAWYPGHLCRRGLVQATSPYTKKRSKGSRLPFRLCSREQTSRLCMDGPGPARSPSLAARAKSDYTVSRPLYIKLSVHCTYLYISESMRWGRFGLLIRFSSFRRVKLSPQLLQHCVGDDVLASFA